MSWAGIDFIECTGENGGGVRLSGVLKVSTNKDPKISYDKASQYLTTLTLNTHRRRWAGRTLLECLGGMTAKVMAG